MNFSLQGICASNGIAIGEVYIADQGQLDIYETKVWPSKIEREVARFSEAVETARVELREIRKRIPADTAQDVATFIDTYLLMLEDSVITSAPIDVIRQRRCNAEWALKMERDQVVSVFDAMEDPYLRTRKDDVDHVVNRIQRILLNGGRSGHERGDGRLAGKVVFADDLAPADVVLMQHEGVAALVTTFGGPSSHTSILARSLRLPAVVGLHQGRQYLRDNDLVIVDGRQATILVNPDDAIVRYFRRRQREIERRHVERRKLRRAPTVTRDGQSIALHANVELPSDVRAAVQVSAAGIGLYRSEFLFMNRERPPDEEEQYQTYVRVVEAFGNRPVKIRTVDIGADKRVECSRSGVARALNPALGLRALRLCLKEESVFRAQIRAILRASAYGQVGLMVPMLSSFQELKHVLRIVDECRGELAEAGLNFDEDIAVGAMVEVPAAAVCADLFGQRLDFLSIGTNDLIQYAIAIDRANDEVNYLYDPLHPGVLRLIQMVIDAGNKLGIPVSMCGEMAGDVRYTRLLLGMGLRELSVHPNALLEVKETINGSDLQGLKALVEEIMHTTSTTTRAALLEQINN